MSGFEELPDEPELAFLRLEEMFHEQVESDERGYSEEGPPNRSYVEYMSRTLAARTELNLSILEQWEVPGAGNFQYETYQSFRVDVVHFRTMFEIRFGRRTKKFSVRLDLNSKRKIHHHITQIREMLAKLPMEDRKRERLIEKLFAFAEEVDRDRTRFESFAAAFVEFAGTIGDVAEAAEPARKWIDSIAQLIWGAKEEEVKQLPPPTERKRIEPPKKQYGRKTTPDPLPSELDDEVPF